ncbi:MarR family transcriptional regulator [Macrococcus hajekii]|uniref:HTH-type transcriptional regulator SarZ n=1 Tax=Macrococcus hajekii TaxID=198482 RepID=A0A4R6BJC6_9STAP|nr:MarR family transcriptional regulator [Macrococcus hajekii]TDM01720.1 MarR family transcriptional regulator [Macrococcus hajekii]GGB06836.1 MarR family transcriptional regulator [Macrococcus hajekii]
MADHLNQLTNQLCFSVYNASRLFIKFYHQALAEFELTYPQYLVLLILWQKDEQPLHEIGRQLNLASNTLTPLLKRMEHAGWIERRAAESDKRQLLVFLTEKGRQHESSILSKIQHCLSDQNIDLKFLQETHIMTQQLEQQLIEIIKK